MPLIPDGFLQEILAHPGDDVPRLVLADYLDDVDTRESRDRAEFIRVQIRLAREYPDSLCRRTRAMTAWHSYITYCRCPVCTLRRREWETSKRWCYGEWSKGLTPESRPVYGRGFVSGVVCPPETWRYFGGESLRRHPLEAVALVGHHPDGPDWHMEWCWLRTGDFRTARPSELPPWLFNGLIGAPVRWEARDGFNVMEYKSEEDALKALSESALSYARLVAQT